MQGGQMCVSVSVRQIIKEPKPTMLKKLRNNISNSKNSILIIRLYTLEPGRKWFVKYTNAWFYSSAVDYNTGRKLLAPTII